MTGKIYYSICSKLFGFLSSLMAIGIEKEKRKAFLAFYVMNVASSNILFSSQNAIKSIAIFTFIMTPLLYIIQKQGCTRDPSSQFLAFILDKEISNLTKPLPFTSAHTNSSSPSIWTKVFITKMFSKKHS